MRVCMIGAGQVNSLRGTCLETRGGSRVVIRGSNFGSIPAAVVSVVYAGRGEAPKPASNCTLVTDHVEVQCDAVEGVCVCARAPWEGVCMRVWVCVYVGRHG